MKRFISKTYSIVRIAAVTVILTVVGAYALGYILLSIPPVQNRLRVEGEKALSDLLHTQVSIEKLGIKPFNELTLEHVAIPDQQGDSLFTIDRVAAGVSIYNLLRHGRLVFTYGEIVGLHGHITRPDKSSPTNMQFLIDAFKPKPNQPPKPFDITIYNVVIRQSDVSYDVLNEPRHEGRFDPNHLHVSGISADVALPRLRNNDFDVELRRLSLVEQSGFDLRSLELHAAINDTTASLTDIQLELPHSVLNVSDMHVSYSSLGALGKEMPTKPLSLTISNSHVTPGDLAAFVPALRNINDELAVTLSANGTLDDVNVPVLSLAKADGTFAVDASGRLTNLRDASARTIDVPHVKLTATEADIAHITAAIPRLSPQARNIIAKCGNVKLDGTVNARPQQVKFAGHVGTSLGEVTMDGTYATTPVAKHFNGHVVTPQLKLGQLLSNNLLNEVALDADVELTHSGGKVQQAAVKGKVDYVDFKGYRYHDIVADVDMNGTNYRGNLSVNDPNGHVELTGTAQLAGKDTQVDALITAADVRLASMGLINAYPAHRLSFTADATFTGNDLTTLDGHVLMNDLSFETDAGTGLHMDQLELEADSHSTPQHIALHSDYVDGEINGSYDFKTLVPSVKHMLGKAFPQLLGSTAQYAGRSNDLTFDFTVRPVEEWQSFFKLPVKLVYDTRLNGHITESAGTFALNVDAPYIVQGKKIIEATHVEAAMDSVTGNVTLQAWSLYPTKKGKIKLGLDANGVNDRLDTHLSWRVMRDHEYCGDISTSTLLQRADDRSVLATINVNPSRLVFNDTAWVVNPSVVTLDHGTITVRDFAAANENQWVRIDGVVSRNPDDVLNLELEDMSLDYVFETLNISNVEFGGRATGHFFASDLLNGSPRLWTPRLHVDGLSYNHAVMGDADIESSWDNEQKAVALHANVSQANGEKSEIDGGIFIGADSLHLDFDAHRANVAFMQTFMSAFTSDVQGEISGHAVLYGTFKDINLYGDICADSLRMKVDFTNVYYTCSGDSVHMVPGLIRFSDVTLRDRDGHTAAMNGWMRHENFHRPVFSFEITDAHDLLCYDTDATFNPAWYGTIYGHGAAFVSGEPGVVNIKVNMESAPRSKFTFVMSDAEEANEYHFITFRDKSRIDAPVVTEEVVDTIPEIVRLLTQQVTTQEESRPTAFTIDLQGDITPDAQLTIVMDPVGGDKIKCTGRGNMRLTYNSDDELAMYGKYTLDKGSYNFTLQDIIIKDFTIRDGSSITFQGDPYAALLDLNAMYSLTANIRDLDESFASDPEIKRTNVPVHALLKANGAISQPDIAFDLEFPTLTTDAYRKVKSVISTDDMMNRQIIYLLALNRFYTPDYMNATTRNNELTSVASSTISSQLSSILGKMSDNWSISPNFRSDKGDFSDMEVDLALSSQLLNNRLLLNGNFGYRDNSLNTRNSNFIGDFDIEYLLNPKGTLRLKAYNHFNDQNYYVRNALTTQGVGIVWKHDFDRPFDFLRRKKAQAVTTDTVSSPAGEPADTTQHIEP